ncbi:SRPBCC family protein [Sphingosinicella sp. CPCC 101087]|uniref:SRPBCC family protein n=1 Tax=Sphingosinicella sp. CPCC 101087 TaxID=2497754 RepID=UPI00101CC920|nr:SRPBCC family protein [Sphingosinicella sp. CPCC 101087]
MTAQVTLEIHAEAAGHIAAGRADVWAVVADLSRRPNLTSWKLLTGVWPDETAQARVAMNKGEFEMVRIETVIRCVTKAQLLLKIEAPEWGSTGWLDHRIEEENGGCRLTIGVIAVATFPEGAGPASRDEYAALSRQGLEQALEVYRRRIEADAD